MRRHDQRRAIAAAAAGTAFSILALVVVATTHRLFPTGGVFVAFGLLTSISCTLFGWSRAKLGERATAVTSLATLGWVPTILVALVRWQEPIFSLDRYPDNHVQSLLDHEVAHLPSIALVLVASSTLLATAARHARFDRALRALTALALVVVFLATGLAVLRSGRPDADHYLVASVPVVGTFGPGDSVTALADGALAYDGMAEKPSCLLRGANYDFEEIDDCEPLVVRHDAKNRLWFWSGKYALRFLFNEREPRHTWISDGDTHWYDFKPASRDAGDVYAVDLAGSIAPPFACTGGALVGSLVGTLLFILALRLGRRRASLFHAIEAPLQPGDWAVLPGHPPRQLAGASDIPPGPVLLRVHGKTQSMAYRDKGAMQIEVLGPGTLEQVHAELSGRAACFYAFALTCALLPAAPLFAFLVVTGGR